MVKLPSQSPLKPLLPQEKEPHRAQKKHPYWLFGLVALGIILMMALPNFIEWEDGKPVLAPWRKEKLAQEIAKYDEAEQYALLADQSGWYPCYNCLDVPTIYLYEGEVWKYGVTINEEKGRYKSGLPFQNLIYLTEFVGPISECLKREKIQIYSYAILPENIKRPVPLIRPPGNKRDH